MISSYVRTLRTFSRDARLYMATPALVGFSYEGIYLLLFNLYLLRLGYGPAFVGLAAGTSQLAFALAGVPSGLIGQRWGSRSSMIAGLAAAALGLGLSPLAEWVPAFWQAVWLLVTFVLAWVGAALYWVNSSPYLMTVTGSRERMHAFSVQSALFPLSAFLGSLAGGLLPGLYARALGLSMDNPAPCRLSLLTAAAVFCLSIPPILATHQQPANAELLYGSGGGDCPDLRACTRRADRCDGRTRVPPGDRTDDHRNFY
jgi:MFS family permease